MRGPPKAAAPTSTVRISHDTQTHMDTPNHVHCEPMGGEDPGVSL